MILRIISVISFVSYVQTSSDNLILSNCVTYSRVENPIFLINLNLARKLADTPDLQFIKSRKVELEVTHRIDRLSQNYSNIRTKVPKFSHFYKKVVMETTDEMFEREAVSVWSDNMYDDNGEYGDLAPLSSKATGGVKCRSCHSRIDTSKFYILVCKWITYADAKAENIYLADFNGFSKVQHSFFVIFINVLLSLKM